MRSILLVLILLLAIISCKNEGNFETEIDDIFKEFNSNNSPGVSVLVKKDSDIIYQKCFGLAKLEGHTPIEMLTNFRLASITKQFTAYSILILENEGKLSLDDKISKYFDELPEYSENITIKNILQHTSGFLDYEDFVDESDSVQLQDKDVLHILSEQDSTYFLPGSKHRYSNSGYAILALLVERISGMTYAEFLCEKIFNPLGMNRSVAYEKGISVVENRAFGYTKTDSGYVDSDQSLTSAILGDGGIYSSTMDLLKWDKEIDDPTLLPKEKFIKIFEKGRTISGEEFDYGYGWRLDPYRNYNRPYHTGSTSGFSNIYMKIPELKLTIIVLINIRDYDSKSYAERIADLFIK